MSPLYEKKRGTHNSLLESRSDFTQKRKNTKNLLVSKKRGRVIEIIIVL